MIGMQHPNHPKRCDSNDESYKPNVILVTGGCGFIGSLLVEKLLSEFPDCRVITYDKISYCSKPHPLYEKIQQNQHKQHDRDVDSAMEEILFKRHVLVRGDICDEKLVNEVIDKYNVDTIMHLAAETHVDRSFHHSLDFTRTNVLGTHVLLQSALDHSKQIRRFVHVSTDEVYGESVSPDGIAMKENSTLNPTNPYAATKVGAEALVQSYIQSFRLPCIITRGNNVYGPGQFPDKVIPKFITRLLSGKSLQIHGNGTAQRNFLYVEDTVSAMITILKHGAVGKIYNIAGREEVTIKQLATMLIDMLVKPEEGSEDNSKIDYVEDRKFNDSRYHIDSSELYKLGWEPVVSLTDGLRRTIDWIQGSSHLMFWWRDRLDQVLEAHPQIHM